MVDQPTLDRIKQTDSSPQIRAYTVGHEGESKFQLPGSGLGPQTFTWVKRAVGWLHDKLSIGTKVFNRHGADNEHTGRIPVGEIVGKSLQTVKDRVSSVAAVYVYPEHRGKKFDVASIEADMEFQMGDGGQSYPVHVEKITGLALSDSDIDSPGFPGATLLGAVAAFHEAQFAKETHMTLAEIKQAVQDGGFSPSQVYDVETIMADQGVDKAVKTAKHDLYKQTERHEKTIGELRDQLAKKDNDHAAELKSLRSETMKGKAGSVLAEVAKARNLTDQQLEFARGNLAVFQTDSDTEDGVKEDVKKFLDRQVADYERTAKLFGIEIPKPGTPDPQPGAQKPGSAPPDNEFDDIEEAPAYDDNPLIPGSKADRELSAQ